MEYEVEGSPFLCTERSPSLNGPAAAFPPTWKSLKSERLRFLLQYSSEARQSTTAPFKHKKLHITTETLK